MRLTPKEAMQMAIEEGKKGAGFVSPNPLVGCVILNREMNLVGQGFHARVGEAAWNNIVGNYLAAAKQGRIADGIVTAIDACAAVIAPGN